MNDELDNLFREAKRHFLAERAKPKAPTPTKAERTEALFANPENWERKRGVCLIHAETQTIIGSFVEFVHRTEPNCRRLVAEDTPLLLSTVEEVSGSWWLPTAITPEPRQVWHSERPCVVHLHLEVLGVHAPAVPVVVHLSHGNIARVELRDSTMFAQDADQKLELLTLAAGTNILPCMSRDCKLKLRQELAL